MQIVHPCFIEDGILETDLFAGLDMSLTTKGSDMLVVKLEALACIANIIKASDVCRCNFLDSQSHTLETLQLLTMECVAGEHAPCTHTVMEAVAGVVLAMCQSIPSDDIADKLIALMQHVFLASHSPQALLCCCKGMQLLCNMSPEVNVFDWRQHTIKKLAVLMMDHTKAYSVSVLAGRAAVSISKCSMDARQEFIEMRLPRLLLPFLRSQTDSLLLHQALELLSVVSISAEYNFMMDMHTSRCMEAAMHVLQKDTWRRHIQQVLVLAQVRWPLLDGYHAVYDAVRRKSGLAM